MTTLEDHSRWLRKVILVPAGGWLAQIVPPLSNATGIWDIFVLAGIFILSWVSLRVSDPLVSMVLGCTFDVSIPLQHHLNPRLSKKHQAHLKGYWPILAFASGVELLCFYLVHPDLITMVICLKTCLMTVIWLARRKDGTWVTEHKASRNLVSPASEPPSKSSKRSKGHNETPVAETAAPNDPNKRRKRQATPKEEQTTGSGHGQQAQASQARAGDPPHTVPAGDITTGIPEDLQDIHAPPGLGPPSLPDDPARQPQPPSPSSSEESEERPSGSRSIGSRFRDRLRKLATPLRKTTLPEPEPTPSSPAAPLFSASFVEDKVKLGRLRAIPVDIGLGCFQAPLTVGNPPRHLTREEKDAAANSDSWEQVLGHDSFELLDFFLLASGIGDYSTRALMLLDIMAERSHDEIRSMAKQWEDAFRTGRGSTLAEPYNKLKDKYLWTARNDCWVNKDPMRIDGTKNGGHMDNLLWGLRQKGLSPAARRSMVRDLMSQPDQESYLQTLEHIYDRAGFDDRPGRLPESKDVLEKRYFEMSLFGGTDGLPYPSEKSQYAKIREWQQAGLTPNQWASHLRRLRWMN